MTVLWTVTKPGRTIEQTVTASAPPPPTTAARTPAPPATVAAPANSSGTELNSEGYTKMAREITGRPDFCLIGRCGS